MHCRQPKINDQTEEDQCCWMHVENENLLLEKSTLIREIKKKKKETATKRQRFSYTSVLSIDACLADITARHMRRKQKVKDVLFISLIQACSD